MDDDKKMKEARAKVAKRELGGLMFPSLEEYIRGQAPDYKPDMRKWE